MSRPTRVTIDLAALRRNASTLRLQAGSRKVMAVVKADAYGHGAVDCAQTLSPLVDAFAVAFTEEALTLRSAGIDTPILVLQGPHTLEDLSVMSGASLWPALSSHHHLDWLSQKGCEFEQVWIKCDTGMHRLGFMPEEMPAIQARLSQLGVTETVLMSHFADAESSQSALTAKQLDRWRAVNEAGHGDNNQGSFSNSAATVGNIGPAETWVRLGYSLYGGSLIDAAHLSPLKPVMQFESRIASIRSIAAGESVGYGGRWVAERPTRIATIPVGYADGYPRSARNGTPLGSASGHIPLIGTVSMDMITADITDQASLNVGDRIVLWGSNPSVDTIAHHCSTIGYELCTRITERVPRQFNPIGSDVD